MMDFIPVHQPPLRIGCRYRKCKASFSRKTDAHRHERQIHQQTKIFCKFQGCRFRGTVRAEVMRKHLKSKHPFDVESTFQIQNDFYRCSLPKANAPFEPSSPTHKVDSFSSWNGHLLSKTFSPNKTDEAEAEQNLERDTDMSYGDLAGNLNGLSGLQQADLDFPIMPMLEYVTYNQESHGRSSVVEGQVPQNMTSCIVSDPNQASDLNEQFFRWKIWSRGPKDCQAEKGHTLADNSTPYCELSALLGAP